MPKLLWGVLCRRLITDQQTNAVSYIDAIEAIGVPVLPSVIAPLALGLVWRRTQPGETLQLRVRLKGPLMEEETPLELEPLSFEGLHHRINIEFEARVEHEGEMLLAVDQQVEGEWQSAYELQVPVLLFSENTAQ
jgi:hypothetical protein